MFARRLSVLSHSMQSTFAAVESDSPTESQSSGPGIALLGVPFESLTLPDAVQRIENMIASGRPHYVVTPNVDFLVQARKDTELRRILIDADLAVCDGTPLRWASNWLGNPLPERVAGADLVPALIRVAAQKGYRLFFLGASPESNRQAVARLEAQYPDLKIAGHYSPPFRPLARMNHAEIAKRIREAKPDLLFVAFGCPKAEKWIAMHYQALGVPVAIGVGATIDFLAGRVKRAPHWMHRAGLEWSYRLIQEPRRLFRRYATDLWEFGVAMTAQWWRTSVWFPAKRQPPVPPRIRRESKWERIELPSRLDAAAVRAHSKIWERVDRHCLLDAEHVRFIDSTGVGLLLYLRKKLAETGRGLVLLAPSRAVERVLEGMRVRDLFVTASSALEARRATGLLTAGQRRCLAKAHRARTTPRFPARQAHPV